MVYYQCENCGLVYQSLEESKAADPEFYRETYRKIYQEIEEPTEKDLWVQKQRAEHLTCIVRDELSDPPQRVLDIGASAGILLSEIRNVFGNKVFGVEPGDAYRAYAQKSDIEMFASLDTLIESTNEKFDLISMSHVLEHLPDPVNDLIKIRMELLKNDGHFIIEVPNFYAHDSYELAHLACFTPHTLTQLLGQAGFEVVYMKKHGVPRSDLLDLYITILGKPLIDVEAELRKERFVGVKRDLGMLYRRLMQKLFPHRAWLPISLIDEG